MQKQVKIPKYIIEKLYQARSHASKSKACIAEFKLWVYENVDEDFDFDILSASASGLSMKDEIHQTEALTEIEYGNEVDIEAIERCINYFYRNDSDE